MKQIAMIWNDSVYGDFICGCGNDLLIDGAMEQKAAAGHVYMFCKRCHRNVAVIDEITVPDRNGIIEIERKGHNENPCCV